MDACVSLLLEVHAQDGYPLEWPADPQAWLSGDRQVGAWIACRAQAICGHVALTRPRPGAAASAWARTLQVHEADLLCISLLFVAPQARGRGTGNRLLDTALAEAQARGAAAALEVITLNRQALPQNEQSLLFVAPGPGPS
jgi:ribosomal protein S18 acetylase RimI-like enzyme